MTATVTPPSMLVVGARDVTREIEADREACVDVVRRAYLAHGRGESFLPHSTFVRFPDDPRNRIISLAGYLGGEFAVSGVKWIASYPGNVDSGLQRASAVLVLNDTTTGFPYVCMEASVVSATRTAASAVLAAEVLLGRRAAERVGIVGTGLIADHVRRFLAGLRWDVGGYRLFDLRREAAERFAAALPDPGAAEVVDRVEAAFEGCDLVVLATVAGEPHVTDPSVLAHAPVVLHLSLRDLAPELVLTAQNVTDDIEHAVRERTSLHLAELRTGHRDFVDGTLADVIEGRLARDPSRATVFSPFGLGVLDLAVGAWVYERVRRRGGGTPVDAFFPSGRFEEDR